MAWVLTMYLLRAQVATSPTPPAIAGAERGRGRGGGGGAAAEPDSAVAEVLENTLWNRQLGVMSEEIVAALVCQIFEGAPPALRAHRLWLGTRCGTGSWA